MISKLSGFTISNRHLVWVVLALQLLLVCITYHKLILHPHAFLFSNQYDGIKNYFTYQYYINQPWQADPFLFIGMNYPFGDNILYTDNMQLVSVPVKLLAEVFPGLRKLALPIYNYLMLLGILLSSYLLVRLLGLLVKSWVLVAAMALVLPWINPQLIRLQVGHMNLSLSMVLLAAVYFLLRIYLSAFLQLPRRKWEVAFALLVILSSFLHIYYLVLVLAFTGFFYLLWLFQALLWKLEWKPIVWSGMLTVALPAAITLGLTRSIDHYSHLRSTVANGYDWIEWKLNFSALFSPYTYKQFRFLFESPHYVPYESSAYLGAFALFGAIAFLLLRWFGNRSDFSVAPLQSEVTGQFLLLLGLASLASLFIALGDYYYIFDGQYRFTNYFNAFFYLHKVTEMVTQFRALGRFVWIFFWAFQFVLLFLLDQSLQKNQSLWLRGIVVLLLGLALIDLKDSMKFFRHHISDNILTDSRHLGEMRDLLQGQNPAHYQAILTIPYFHVGTEGEYDYTIDPDEPVSNASMQVSLITGLPLMASKLARTPPEFGPIMFSIFTAPSPELLQHLDSRPVLVLYNKSYYDGRNNFYDNVKRETARETIRLGADLPQRYNMQQLSAHNDWVLYSWHLKEGSATAR